MLAHRQVITATPAFKATGAPPSRVAPSRNSTLPPGVPAVPASTVAVSVTASPATDDAGLPVRVVVVDAFCTVTATADDVLAAKLPAGT